MTDRTFDRLPEFDEQSRAFPIRTLIAAARPRNCRWTAGAHLDQGSEGACVGFSWSGELLAKPMALSMVDNTFAREVYREAQKVDEWPGESYSGTSVLAGAKVIKTMGYIGSYRWCFGLNDLLLALSWNGPVILGVNWYDGMYNTDPQGYVHVTGTQVGGHAIMAYGINVTEQYVLLRNSWGADWGVRGDCKVSWADMDRLLHEQGEACVPMQRRSGPVRLAHDGTNWWTALISWLRRLIGR